MKEQFRIFHADFTHEMRRSNCTQSLIGFRYSQPLEKFDIIELIQNLIGKSFKKKY